MAKDKKKNEVMLANDAIEYQPDAIELASSRLPWWARMGVLWLFVFFVGMIVWASVSKVDVIVQCRGKVTTRVNTISMMPPERMVIDKICVREGDHVHAGDLLFVFDPTINDADFKKYSDNQKKLEASFNRLKAEFHHDDYVPSDPKDHDQFIQKTIFDRRKNSYDVKWKYYTSQINSAESDIKSIEASLANTNEGLKIYQDIVNRYRSLLEKNVISVVEMSNAEMTLLNYQNQRDQYQNALPSYKSKLASSIQERQAYVESWEEQVAEEYNQAEQDLTENTQLLEKVKRYQGYYELRAPREAIVQEVAKYAKGSAVREAEPLITLIPVGKNLTYIIEIEIPAKDISKVKVDDAVRVKLSAYPFQTWGTMKGTLKQISEDIFTRNPQQSGLDASTMLQGTSYYRGEVELTPVTQNDPGRFYTKEPPNFQMRPGMEAQAEIITGDRRIISYVFHPLIKMLDESVREP